MGLPRAPVQPANSLAHLPHDRLSAWRTHASAKPVLRSQLIDRQALNFLRQPRWPKVLVNLGFLLCSPSRVSVTAKTMEENGVGALLPLCFGDLEKLCHLRPRRGPCESCQSPSFAARDYAVSLLIAIAGAVSHRMPLGIAARHSSQCRNPASAGMPSDMQERRSYRRRGRCLRSCFFLHHCFIDKLWAHWQAKQDADWTESGYPGLWA